MADNDITKQMISLCKTIGARFSMNDNILTLEQVFDYSGALPLIARSAEELSMMCLEYGIGAQIEEMDGTMFGYKVAFDDDTPNSLRLLFLIDIILDLANGAADAHGTIPLDSLLYDS